MEFEDFRKEIATRTRRAAARSTDMADAARLFETLAVELLEECGGPLVLFDWYPELLEIGVTLPAGIAEGSSASSVLEATALQALLKLVTTAEPVTPGPARLRISAGAGRPKSGPIPTAEISDRVVRSRDLALGGDVAGSRRLLDDMVMEGEATAAEIRMAMSDADPDRIVWPGPLRGDATGAGGYPIVEARFEICSDSYGHFLDRQFEASEEDAEFLDACAEGFDDMTLHDQGNVAYDLSSGRYVFLVSVVLDPEDGEVDADAVASVGKAHAVETAAMSFSRTPLDLGGGEGARAVVAVIRDAKQFRNVSAIMAELAECVVAQDPAARP